MPTSRVVIEVEVDENWNRMRLLLSVVALPHVTSVVELEHDGFGGYEHDESTRHTVSVQ